MEYKKIGNKYIVRLNIGEDIVETLKTFCTEQQITLGWVQGIGAVDKANLGFFQVGTKEYYTKDFTGDYEVTSLLGNVTTKDGEVYLHLHITLSDEEYKTYGGHLNSAIISVTGEIVIEAIEGTVERQMDEEIGINLFKFN